MGARARDVRGSGKAAKPHQAFVRGRAKKSWFNFLIKRRGEREAPRVITGWSGRVKKCVPSARFFSGGFQGSPHRRNTNFASIHKRSEMHRTVHPDIVPFLRNVNVFKIAPRASFVAFVIIYVYYLATENVANWNVRSHQSGWSFSLSLFVSTIVEIARAPCATCTALHQD